MAAKIMIVLLIISIFLPAAFSQSLGTDAGWAVCSDVFCAETAPARSGIIWEEAITNGDRVGGRVVVARSGIPQVVTSWPGGPELLRHCC